ncbi:MAG: hypothetical protein RR034_07945, partial [Bacteroidales bacterium]
MKTQNQFKIYGYGGDALTAPAHTEVAFWAALAGGATGIVTKVSLSREGILYCTSDDLTSLTTSEISKIDTGSNFRSQPLDAENMSAGNLGTDLPWKGFSGKKRAIGPISLEQLLLLFARRSEVIILIEDDNKNLINTLLTLLGQLGLMNKVYLMINGVQLCSEIAKKNAGIQLICHDLLKNIYADYNCGADCFCIDDTDIDQLRENEPVPMMISFGLAKESKKKLAPNRAFIQKISKYKNVEGIIAPAILPTVESITPSACILQDNFEGNVLNRKSWSAGYSHINQDTEIFQDNGMHIKIKDGGQYSGAAAICLLPIHGRFDAQVDFYAESSKQASTFEMAAICIDPGHCFPDNKNLNTKTVSLTFDVHGAPPYASSERDEDDGFRCGWNNSFNFTKIDENWDAASGNMYNQYGRDVGNADENNNIGSLRLIRNGSVFASYYKDKYNEWKQTSNPIDTGTITGYEPIHIDMTGSGDVAFVGLGLSQ